MRREPNIPIVLWVATAALAHILWGGGAEQIVRVVESRSELSRFAQSVSGHVKRSNAKVEVTLLTEAEALPEPEADPDPETDPDEEPEEVPEVPAVPEAPREPIVAKETEPSKLPLPDPVKPEPKAKPKPKPEETLAVPVQPLEMDRRVAVEQTPEDPSQAENPSAEFIGEHNNKVEKQTQARITSTDQNEAQAALETDHEGASDDPGSSDVSELAQSRDAPGDPEEAPSESDEDGLDKAEAKPALAKNDPAQTVFGEAAPRSAPETDKPPVPASRGQTAQLARPELEASPRLLTSPNGRQTAPAEREAQKAQEARKAIKEQRQVRRPSEKLPKASALGTLQTTPGGLDPNLTPLSALSAIGSERLERERVADGERRRSKHRGSFRAVGLERWRSAIENYVASVQPGNQTALNTAAKPFARYLNHIHNRLHPQFAHNFLGSLDGLPGDHPMNRPDIRTHIEIVLSAEDGRVLRMGITRASGSTAFDVGALEAVQESSPFGTPPREIVSPDGRVYLHWEFHRDPNSACSTYFARPFILRVAPSPAPIPEPPSPSTPEEKHGANERLPTQRPPDEDKLGG